MTVDPAQLRILHLPAPQLRQKGAPVAEITDHVRQVAQRMIELTHLAEGIGLAAPQVGLPWRLFVVDVPENDERSAASDPAAATRGPEVYINPVFSSPSRATEPFEEGCLSLPDIRGRVIRPVEITITATNLQGERFTRRAGGLLARCWQHEFDHLDGVLIIDRMLGADRLKNRVALRHLEHGE